MNDDYLKYIRLAVQEGIAFTHDQPGTPALPKEKPFRLVAQVSIYEPCSLWLYTSWLHIRVPGWISREYLKQKLLPRPSP